MYTRFKIWTCCLTTILFVIGLFHSLSAQPIDLKATFTSNNGLPSSSINQIIRDEEGSVWIATENGISIKNTTKPILKKLQETLKGSVKQIAFSKKNIFLALTDALNIYDKNDCRLLKSYNVSIVGNVRKMRVINDIIWILSDKNIFLYKNSVLVSVPYLAPNSLPFDITLFKGNIYVLTYPTSRLLVFDGSVFRESPYSKKINPLSGLSYLTMKSKGDTLVLGGDHCYCFLIGLTRTKILIKKLKIKVQSNPAIWDIEFVRNQIYFAFGNTHSVKNGGVFISGYKDYHSLLNM